MAFLSFRNPYCSAVIVAAGSAARMRGVDKIMAELDGTPVIVRTMQALAANASIREIVVVTRDDLIAPIAALAAQYGISKVQAVVSGGASRAESVMCGLSAVSKKQGLVAIHDGARPLVTDRMIAATIRCAQRFHAAAPAVPVKDTVKIAAADRIVRSTPERSTLFAVQTPQVFDFDLIRSALQKALADKAALTDDCSAVELFGMSVHLTDGSDENIKITTPIDLTVAEAILRGRKTDENWTRL